MCQCNKSRAALRIFLFFCTLEQGTNLLKIHFTQNVVIYLLTHIITLKCWRGHVVELVYFALSSESLMLQYVMLCSHGPDPRLHLVSVYSSWKFYLIIQFWQKCWPLLFVSGKEASAEIFREISVALTDHGFLIPSIPKFVLPSLPSQLCAAALTCRLVQSASCI